MSFHLLADCTEYDHGDNFPSNFEQDIVKSNIVKSNGLTFGSKSKGNCHHNHIPFNLKAIANLFLRIDRKNSVPITTMLEKLHPLSESLASTGIMRGQLRAPCNPSDHHSTVILGGLRRGLELFLHYTERCQSLGQWM